MGCHVKSWKGWGLFHEIDLLWKKNPQLPISVEKSGPGTSILTGTVFPCHCSGFSPHLFLIDYLEFGCCQLPLWIIVHSNEELTEGRKQILNLGIIAVIKCCFFCVGMSCLFKVQCLRVIKGQLWCLQSAGWHYNFIVCIGGKEMTIFTHFYVTLCF